MSAYTEPGTWADPIFLIAYRLPVEAYVATNATI